MFHEIKNYFKHRRKKKAIKSIRETAAYLGHDLSDITDEEIEQGTVRFSKLIVQSGFTAREVQDAFKSLLDQH